MPKTDRNVQNRYEPQLTGSIKADFRTALADRRSGHAFIWHGDGLHAVEVRYCHGEQLEEYFAKWEADEPYSNPNLQRFRRSVSAGWVRANTKLVLRVVDGEADHVWRRVRAEDDDSNGVAGV